VRTQRMSDGMNWMCGVWVGFVPNDTGYINEELFATFSILVTIMMPFIYKTGCFVEAIYVGNASVGALR
jgi:hypothetical protein